MKDLEQFIMQHKWFAIAAVLVGLVVGWYLFVRKKGYSGSQGILSTSSGPILEPPVVGSPGGSVLAPPSTTTPLPGTAPGTASTVADQAQPSGSIPVSAANNLLSIGTTTSLPVYSTPVGPSTTPYGPTTQPQGLGQNIGVINPGTPQAQNWSNPYPGSVQFNPQLAQAIPSLFPGQASLASEASSTNPDVFQNYINISGAIASATAYASSRGGTAIFEGAGQPIQYQNSSGQIVDPASWQPTGH